MLIIFVEAQWTVTSLIFWQLKIESYTFYSYDIPNS